MSSREFAYWLQGFFEISGTSVLTEKQVMIVKNHLNLVFKHEIDPSYSSDPKVQDDMQKIHDGFKKNTFPYISPAKPMFPSEEDKLLRC